MQFATPFAALSAIAMLCQPGPANARTTVGARAEWTAPGGDPQGTRYSTLKDITAANAGTLVADFTINTNQAGSHEASRWSSARPCMWSRRFRTSCWHWT